MVKYKNIIKLYIIIPIVFICIYIFVFCKLNLYNENRIYSIRKVPIEYRISLLKNFIDKKYQKNSILLLGDSQPNGYMYPEDLIFSKLLEKKLNKNILNLAFQDSRIIDNTIILQYLLEKGMKFNSIIFNVNQSHIKDSGFSHLMNDNNQDYVYGILKSTKAFVNFVENPNPIMRPFEDLQLRKYGNNYFEINSKLMEEYILKLKVFINIAKSLTDNLIIYVTPHALNAVEYNNKNDIEILNKFKIDFLIFCKNQNIKCINIDISEDIFFIDIVHFNSKGHKKMSQILSEYL
ncbi:hypothetical protein [Campylobacter hyointestinalis]|uniref:hypothetical protein n=1 Tax=Campylobacter hyointestinalis TaxID=198 RepID=UPI000DCDB222|nr:hypothetical protein [Campylobacter hyointestinalis]RAZ45698.1 hypothetical protein CHL14416_07670 [Campylobacter hyointestinalis subsp. lawsonii]